METNFGDEFFNLKVMRTNNKICFEGTGYKHLSSDFCHSAGFSLVEVLVSLAVFSLLASVMMFGLQQFVRVNALEKRLAAKSVLESAADFLETEISNVQKLSLSVGSASKPRFLLGSNETLRLVTLTKTGHNIQRLMETEYSLHLISNVSTLMVSQRTRRFSQKIDEQLRIVLKGVSKIRFRYLFVDRKGSAEWHEDWDKEQRLPKAIRFTMTGSKSLYNQDIERLVILESTAN